MFDTRQLKNAQNPRTHTQNAAESSFAPNVIARKPFADDRQEAVSQRKLQAGIQQSPQVQALAQLQSIAAGKSQPQAGPQQRKNETGLPDQLKSGIESMSGMDMSDVRVHYGSDKPAQLQAHAYAQGNDIHLGPGQEQHLAHEAWHVVQQRQGRVQPTKQLKGKTAINDDQGLEREADVMGAKAMQLKGDGSAMVNDSLISSTHRNGSAPVQRMTNEEEGKDTEKTPSFEETKKFLIGKATTYYSNVPCSCDAQADSVFKAIKKFGVPDPNINSVSLFWIAKNGDVFLGAQNHIAITYKINDQIYVVDSTIDQFGGSNFVFFGTIDQWEEEVFRLVEKQDTTSEYTILEKVRQENKAYKEGKLGSDSDDFENTFLKVHPEWKEAKPKIEDQKPNSDQGPKKKNCEIL